MKHIYLLSPFKKNKNEGKTEGIKLAINTINQIKEENELVYSKNDMERTVNNEYFFLQKITAENNKLQAKIESKVIFNNESENSNVKLPNIISKSKAISEIKYLKKGKNHQESINISIFRKMQEKSNTKEILEKLKTQVLQGSSENIKSTNNNVENKPKNTDSYKKNRSNRSMSYNEVVKLIRIDPNSNLLKRNLVLLFNYILFRRFLIYCI